MMTKRDQPCLQRQKSILIWLPVPIGRRVAYMSLHIGLNGSEVLENHVLYTCTTPVPKPFPPALEMATIPFQGIVTLCVGQWKPARRLNDPVEGFKLQAPGQGTNRQSCHAYLSRCGITGTSSSMCMYTSELSEEGPCDSLI
jgi:hypothetical protein